MTRVKCLNKNCTHMIEEPSNSDSYQLSSLLCSDCCKILQRTLYTAPEMKAEGIIKWYSDYFKTNEEFPSMKVFEDNARRLLC